MGGTATAQRISLAIGVTLALSAAAACASRATAGSGAPPTIGQTATTPGPVLSQAAGFSPPPSPPAPTGPVASVAVLECTTGHDRILTPFVRVQPDGVHVRIENPTSLQRTYDIQSSYGSLMPGQSITRTVPIPPGYASIACWNGDAEDMSRGSTFVATDPAHLWVSDLITVCNAIFFGGEPDTDRGRPGDPARLARQDVHGLQPGDRLERAGYPAGNVRESRVMRGGTVEATVEYDRTRSGTWRLAAANLCGGVDFHR